MAITYADLFGDIAELILTIETLEATMASLETHRSDIITQYTASGVTNLINGINERFDGFITQLESMTQELTDQVSARILDRETVIEELPELESGDINEVMFWLISDMLTDSENIKKSTVTVGSITTTTTNTNTGTLILSSELPGDTEPGQGFQENRNMASVVSELSLDDSIVVICTDDSQGGGTVGAETFSVTGLLPQASLPFESNQGGNQGSLTISPAPSDSLISNFFESFTSDLPTGWTEDSGAAVAGTDYGADAVTYMLGSNSLFFDGGEANPAQMNYNIYDLLVPGQNLCLMFWLRREATTTGVLTMTLAVDGSTLATDAIDVAAEATSTGWTLFSYEFIVPDDIGLDDGTTYLRFEDTSVAVEKVYVDGGALKPFEYHAGIGFVISEGPDKFLKDDRFEFTLANDDAGKFQRFFSRAFGYQIPSVTSGSETISEPV